MLEVVFYLLVGLFGAVVGASEIVSRYKDAPVEALQTVPGMFYIAINAFAALAAFALILHFNWLEAAPATGTDLAVPAPDPATTLIVQSMIAGFGAMTFFRSSLFTVRVGNTDIEVGPAGFLKVILEATDRECDRQRAGPRAAAIRELMREIDFAKARDALPSLCFGLMQNVSQDEQRAFSAFLADLNASSMDATFKANSLGLALMNIVGERVLEQAIGVIRTNIAQGPRALILTIETLGLIRKFDFDTTADELIDYCQALADTTDGVRDEVREQANRLKQHSAKPSTKALMLCSMLVRRYGEGTVASGLRALTP